MAGYASNDTKNQGAQFGAVATAPACTHWKLRQSLDRSLSRVAKPPKRLRKRLGGTWAAAPARKATGGGLAGANMPWRRPRVPHWMKLKSHGTLSHLKRASKAPRSSSPPFSATICSVRTCLGGRLEHSKSRGVGCALGSRAPALTSHASGPFALGFRHHHRLKAPEKALKRHENASKVVEIMSENGSEALVSLPIWSCTRCFTSPSVAI